MRHRFTLRREWWARVGSYGGRWRGSGAVLAAAVGRWGRGQGSEGRGCELSV